MSDLPLPTEIEFGVHDNDRHLLKDAVAVYGIRGVWAERTSSYAVSLNCVDFAAISLEAKNSFTRLLNDVLLDVVKLKAKKAGEDGMLDKFSDAVALVDWNRYKVYARRQTGYINIFMAEYNEPLDFSNCQDDLHLKFVRNWIGSRVYYV